MEYLKVEWVHNFLDEPNIIYSELDENRNELRKIEMYRDGKVGFATNDIEFGGTALSIEPIPSISEIGSDDQFIPSTISKTEFDEIWNQLVHT